MAMLTFFDVETPNRKNDRISAIGLIKTTDSGEVVDCASFLVNPEASFDDLNMEMTGICPALVKGERTFERLWEDCLSDWFSNSIVVAHNAAFDLSVLCKSLMGYGLKRPVLPYLCTLSMTKFVHPEYENYKLPSVCKHLGIKMGTHHQAMDDVEACYQIYMALSEEISPNIFVSDYVFDDYLPYVYHNKRPRAYCAETEQYRGLIKMVEQLLEVGEVSYESAMDVLGYIDACSSLENDPTVEKVRCFISAIVADGDIDPCESEELIALLKGIDNPLSLRGGCDLVIKGKKFCLSGSFEHGSKDAMKNWIESQGGECLPSVTKKCDYVLVGGCGSEAWTTAHYGSKIKKAMDLQNRGVPIQIIGEDQLNL